MLVARFAAVALWRIKPLGLRFAFAVSLNAYEDIRAMNQILGVKVATLWRIHPKNLPLNNEIKLSGEVRVVNLDNKPMGLYLIEDIR